MALLHIYSICHQILQILLHFYLVHFHPIYLLLSMLRLAKPLSQTVFFLQLDNVLHDSHASFHSHNPARRNFLKCNSDCVFLSFKVLQQLPTGVGNKYKYLTLGHPSAPDCSDLISIHAQKSQYSLQPNGDTWSFLNQQTISCCSSSGLNDLGLKSPFSMCLIPIRCSRLSPRLLNIPIRCSRFWFKALSLLL